MRPPEPRRVLGAVVVVAALLLGGCGSGERPTVSPGPGTPTTSAPPATVPADGVTLRALGYANGPIEQFSLPRIALVTTAVDQPNNVVAVLSTPPPVDVADYLRRTLPATGFTVTADDAAGPALTFTGYGWTGSFTATNATSVVLLRPA